MPGDQLATFTDRREAIALFDSLRGRHPNLQQAIACFQAAFEMFSLMHSAIMQKEWEETLKRPRMNCKV